MMIGLIGVIDETDYIRYSQKFLKERKQVEENIESLKQKIEIITKKLWQILILHGMEPL